MKRITLILATIAIILTIGIAGKYDMASEVVYTMDAEVYDTIVRKLGTANEIEIAEEYLNNKEYYDETYGW